MPTPNFNFPTISQSDTANVPRDHNALANAVDTAFQQTEYQTATVVGAQIRITKPSASNRVFFRLATAINGGAAITISTDGGTTSVNLTDIDGANVTMLEKGFAEIVKVGNFFILRNRGLNPAQLQALITITNEAEANESVLRTNYVDTVNGLITPPPLSSDASWNDILLQLTNINTRTISGTANSSSAYFTFTRYSSTTASTLPAVTVPYNQVGFIPTKIEIRNLSGAGAYNTFYYKALINSNDYISISLMGTGYSTEALSYGLKSNSGDAYVNSTGFRLPVLMTNTSYSWIAYK